VEWWSIDPYAMSDLRNLLSSAADTLCVHTAGAFAVFGTRYEILEAETELDGFVLSPKGRAILSEILYSVLHCREIASRSPEATDWAAKREFTYSLSAANVGDGSWRPGWVVSGVESDGVVVAEHNGIHFWIPASDFRSTSRSFPPAVGDCGWAKTPKECLSLQPGFYLALGDAGPGSSGSETVRLYWHLWSGGAARLVRSLTGTLNRTGIAFELKLLAEPGAYPRSDAAVLYVSRYGYGRIRSLLPGIYQEVQPWLRQSVSVFAKWIAPGLGLAEDPGANQSFGQHRCTLVATELSRRDVFSSGSGVERCRAVLARLQQLGWDPERLYLNPGSVDCYLPLDVTAQR
jgi:hypothetical protein